MGCSPQNVIIRRDNVQMGSDVIILDDQSAKVAKLMWDFNPVKSDDNGRTMTSYIAFTPNGNNTKKIFTENIYVEVFDSKYQYLVHQTIKKSGFLTEFLLVWPKIEHHLVTS